MKILKWLHRKYGKQNTRIVFIVLAVIVIIFLTGRTDTDNLEGATENLRAVRVETVSALSNDFGFSVIGSVRSINEAHIETETGGRIISTSVSLGEDVRSGAILAQIENRSQYARLLQAQGSYEAALALAEQSDLTVKTAETNFLSTQNSAVNTYRTAFTTGDDIVKSLLDEFFSDPTQKIFGLRINGYGDSLLILKQRTEISEILIKWSTSLSTISSADISKNLIQAKQNILTIQSLTTTLSSLLTRESYSSTSSFTDSEIAAYNTRFLTAQTNLNITLQNIENTLLALESSETAFQTAQFSNTQSEVSTANAQVKQALGSLRLAESEYAKTVIRTPISGTLNMFSLNTGDYVSAGSEVAVVANNNAYEVTTFVSKEDSALIAIGDLVQIDNSYIGTITNISPAVNQKTGKVEVIIQADSEEIINGGTVSVSFEVSKESTGNNSQILIPITAVKFSAEDGFVMQVQDSIIIKTPVVLGRVQGTKIEILEGLSQDMEIIIDTRGMSEGEKVTVSTN